MWRRWNGCPATPALDNRRPFHPYLTPICFTRANTTTRGGLRVRRAASREDCESDTTPASPFGGSATRTAGFLSNGSTRWRDERAENRAGQQELQICGEAPRAVPASAAVEEFAAARAQERQDVLEVGCGARRGARRHVKRDDHDYRPSRRPRETRADATSRTWRAVRPQDTPAEVGVAFPTNGDGSMWESDESIGDQAVVYSDLRRANSWRPASVSRQ